MGATAGICGAVFPMKDQDGQVIFRFGSATDIDDQKRAEEALRESELRDRALADSTRDIIYILDRQGVRQVFGLDRIIRHSLAIRDPLREGDLVRPKWPRQAEVSLLPRNGRSM